MGSYLTRIERRMRDITVSDDELFKLPAFTQYITDLFRYQCNRYSVYPPPVIIDTRGDSCYTDGKKIVVGTKFPIVRGSRADKVKSIIGLAAHEFGHYLYTDFTGLKNMTKALQRGAIYPAPRKSDMGRIGYENYKDLLSYLRCEDKEDDESVKMFRVRVITKLMHSVQNILEDGYLEKTEYSTMTGIVLDGLDHMRAEFYDDQFLSPATIKEMRAKKVDDAGIARSMLLQFALYETWPEDVKKARRKDDTVKLVLSAEKLILKATHCHVPKDRDRMFNGIFCILWPVFKKQITDPAYSPEHILDMLSRMPDDMDDWAGAVTRILDMSIPEELRGSALPMMGGMSEESDGDSSGEGGKSAGDGEPKDGSGKTPKKGSGGKKSSGSSDSGEESSGSGGDKSDGAGDKDEDGDKKPGSGSKGKDGDKSSDAHDGDDESRKPSYAPKRSDGDVDGEAAHGGADRSEGVCEDGDESSTSRIIREREFEASLRRLETEARRAAAEEAIEEEIAGEMSELAGRLDYGTPHAHIGKRVIRKLGISEAQYREFEELNKEVGPVVKIMARRIKNILKKNSDSDIPFSGLYSGSRFDCTRVIRGDMRYFRKNATPLADTRLAVSVLVDESGSMGGSRINHAREAAFAVYMFCKELDIPCAVDGHTAPFGPGRTDFSTPKHGGLIINSYADFDDVDGKDKYRILGIQAYEDNRDGAAILYAGSRLLQREEPSKILMIISDGAPCAHGYSGVAAENDMSAIVADLQRKGVVIFALAIGADKPQTHRIYGDRFLDITDIEKLPEQMVQLVKRNIKFL